MVDGDFVMMEPTRISGIVVYDSYMLVYASLAVWVAASINSGQTWWLHDEKLLEQLKWIAWIDPSGPARKGKAECAQRSRQCAEVMRRMEMAVQEMNGREEWARFFVPAEAAGKGLEEVGRLIDRTGMQMLRDVFYVVTGVETPGDTVWCGSAAKRRPQAEVLLAKAGLEVEWGTVCSMEDEEGAEADDCGYYTGLVPVISRVFGQQAWWEG